MTKRTLNARLKLIKQSLDLFERKTELLRRSCAELGEELFNALDRCRNGIRAGEGWVCACEACDQARLCMESNARQYEELLHEEQRLMEASGLVKAPPAVEERH